MTFNAAAAVIYKAENKACTCLKDFAAELKASGTKVGGLLQEMLSLEHGKLGGIEAIEIDTGRRIPIKTPHTEATDPDACMLQIDALAECSGALRRAIADQAGLVIVEKFGKQEAAGEGIVDDIIAVIAEGLPTLVAVPENYLEAWNTVTGGDIVQIECDSQALHQWWQGQK